MKFYIFLLSLNLAISENGFFGSQCDEGCVFAKTVVITSESIKNFPSNCSRICANLEFNDNSNLSEIELLPMFQNLKELFGSLKFVNTNFESASFLASLAVIECDSGGFFKFENNQNMKEIGMKSLIRCVCDFEVSLAPKLEKLNFPLLKNFTHSSGNISQVEMSISNVSSNFCITFQEMQHFMMNENLFLKNFTGHFCKQPGKYCADVCEIESSNIYFRCEIMSGSIVVNSENQLISDALNTVKWIFGNLKIENTNMTKFHVLNSLEYVVSLDNSNAIEIVGNRKLVEISIPNLKRVQTNQKRWLQIQGNNEKLTDFVIEQDQFCKTLTNYNGENQFVSEIDGKICREKFL